jgi:DNA-binding CsgD family transcriptional regulator
MADLIVLRVNWSGTIVGSNQAAVDWLRCADSPQCHRVVAAEDLNGLAVCHGRCAHQLAAAAVAGGARRRVIVRGQVAELECHGVGDEVVVLVHPSGERAPHPNELLTKPETDVLMLTADGYKTEEIAALLLIPKAMVRHRLAQATARLGVKTRAEAVRKAASTGQLGARARPDSASAAPPSSQPRAGTQGREQE